MAKTSETRKINRPFANAPKAIKDIKAKVDKGQRLTSSEKEKFVNYVNKNVPVE